MLEHQKISVEMALSFMPLLIWLKDLTTDHVSEQSLWLHLVVGRMTSRSMNPSRPRCPLDG
mgnify:CR=1 FL=1